jgi:hypothetical protein
VIATWLPMTWAQTIVIASHCVGFTFPGMIDEPGSFLGRGREVSCWPERSHSCGNTAHVHGIACKCSAKWVGIVSLRRQQGVVCKGAGRPPLTP